MAQACAAIGDDVPGLAGEAAGSNTDNSQSLSARVYVENVAFDATDRQLKKFLTRFGVIRSCVIQRHSHKGRLRNGCLFSRGYAFVQFGCEDSAREAIGAEENKLKFRRRFLRILPATKKTYGAGVEFENYYGRQQESVVVQYQPVTCPEQFQTPLPPEDLVRIFRCLDRVDLLVCASVCRQWYSATVDTWSANKTLTFDGSNGGSFSQRVVCPWARLRSCDLFRYLYLTGFGLEELVLTRHCEVDREGLVIIGKACPRLKRLELAGVKTTAFSWHKLTKCCPLLEEVVLNGCIDEKSLRSLLHNCPLRVLKVDLFSGTGTSFRCLPSPSLLESVAFQHCDSLQSANLCTLLERSPKITSLNLAHWFLCDVPFFHYIGRVAPQLQTLCLSNTLPTNVFFPNFNQPTYEVGKYGSMPQLPSLVSLDLSAVSFLTDVILESVVSKLGQLQQLNLSCCRELGDRGMQALASHCPGLRDLDISYVQTITEAGMHYLADGCPHLEELALRNCEALNDESLVEVVTNCPRLRLLDISSCWCFSRSIADTLDVCRIAMPRHSAVLSLVVGGSNVAERDASKELRTIDCSLANTARGTVDHFFMHGFLGPEGLVDEDVDDIAAFNFADIAAEPLDGLFGIGGDFFGLDVGDPDVADHLELGLFLDAQLDDFDWVDNDFWPAGLEEVADDVDNGHNAAWPEQLEEERWGLGENAAWVDGQEDLWPDEIDADDMFLGPEDMWDDVEGAGWAGDVDDPFRPQFLDALGMPEVMPPGVRRPMEVRGDGRPPAAAGFVRARALVPDGVRDQRRSRRSEWRGRHGCVVPSWRNWLFALSLDVLGPCVSSRLLVGHWLGLTSSHREQPWS